MDVNSSTDVCALNADACGTGNTYPVTVRPTTGGGGGTGGDLDGVVSAVIDRLANVIEFSHLAQSLRTRIDIINTLEKGLNDISTKVATDNSVMAQQLLGLRGDLTDAVAYINSQVTIELNERQALVNSINQIVASLGNGLSAALQEESTVRAEQTGALFAEKTVKTDLAGNVSGYGLSSYVDKTGAVSDFRVAADRFSIAPPAYVSPAPPPYNQIHDGKVWVDTSGGGKGVTKWWSAAQGTWVATPVAAAQPFVYLTTPQILPDGTVVQPGLYVNSASITKLTADKIDTRGLTIKDGAGNILFGAGTPLSSSYIYGLGALATKNAVHIGSTVRFPDGTVLNTNDFVHRLSKINSGNIGTYIDGAAITNAYIGNAAVETLTIAGNAVTAVGAGRGGTVYPPTTLPWTVLATTSIYISTNSSNPCLVNGTVSLYAAADCNMVLGFDFEYVGLVGTFTTPISLSAGKRQNVTITEVLPNPPTGIVTVRLIAYSEQTGSNSKVPFTVLGSVVTLQGAKR